MYQKKLETRNIIWETFIISSLVLLLLMCSNIEKIPDSEKILSLKLFYPIYRSIFVGFVRFKRWYLCQNTKKSISKDINPPFESAKKTHPHSGRKTMKNSQNYFPTQSIVTKIVDPTLIIPNTIESSLTKIDHVVSVQMTHETMRIGDGPMGISSENYILPSTISYSPDISPTQPEEDINSSHYEETLDRFHKMPVIPKYCLSTYLITEILNDKQQNMIKRSKFFAFRDDYPPLTDSNDCWCIDGENATVNILLPSHCRLRAVRFGKISFVSGLLKDFKIGETMCSLQPNKDLQDFEINMDNNSFLLYALSSYGPENKICIPRFEVYVSIQE